MQQDKYKKTEETPTIPEWKNQLTIDTPHEHTKNGEIVVRWIICGSQ